MHDGVKIQGPRKGAGWAARSAHIVMGVHRLGWGLRNRASASGEHVAADSAGCTSQAETH